MAGSDYAKVQISPSTKEKVAKALISADDDGEDPHAGMEYHRLREKEVEMESWRKELNDRERSLDERESDFEHAKRMLEEKLGGGDIVKTINELNQEKERQRLMQEELHNEKQKTRQLGLKLSQEVKRAKAGFLREQKKLEQAHRDLDEKRAALDRDHKLMTQQIEDLERISSGGNMTVIQNLSNRVLELTRVIAENESASSNLQQSAAQLKEQLNHSNQENNELQQRHSKLKHNRDQLKEENRNLKGRINELDLERIRMRDSEDKLIDQIQHWEAEHANSNTELENLLRTLLEIYRGDNHMPSNSVGPTPQSRRSANPYSSRLMEPSRKTPTRSSRGSIQHVHPIQDKPMTELDNYNENYDSNY